MEPGPGPSKQGEASPSSPPQGPPPSHILGLLHPRPAHPGGLFPAEPYVAARSTGPGFFLPPPPPPLYTGPFLPVRYYAPATFYAGGPRDHAGLPQFHPYPRASVAASTTTNLLPPLHAAPRNPLLPGGYYGDAAFQDPRAYYDPASVYAARPTDPRAFLAAGYTHFAPDSTIVTTSSSTDLGLGSFLGMRISEALRLGVHPPPPIDATAVAPQPMTWIVGASTGEFTTPYGSYRPRSSTSTMGVTVSSTPAPAVHMLRGESSSSSQPHPHFDATPTSSSARRANCEETRAKVLHGDPIAVAALLKTREFAGQVILLLEEGDEEARVRLLTIVKPHIHKIMEHPTGSDVFGALLRSCKDHPDDLQGVVQAFTERNDAAWSRWIVRRAKDSDDVWMDSFAVLFSAVSEYPDLCVAIVNCLIRQNISCNARGAELLKMCFASFPYDQAKNLIQDAVADMNINLHQTQFGSKFLEECFNHAKGDEIYGVQESVLNRAKEMALSQYSYVLQHVLKYGSDEFLCSVVNSFLHLSRAELDELVTGRSSNFVIRTMLDTGRVRLPVMARRFAEHISTLGDNILNHRNGRLVLKSVNKALE